MPEFWLFFEKGLRHILNPHDYDHILFLIALTIPFAFKDWLKLFFLVSSFTLGHSLALLLSLFGIITIKGNFVEFLIPITILIVAVFHLFSAGKSSKNESISIILFITLFFGIIHGLGYAAHFKTIASGHSKMLPLLEFGLGIETGQIIVVVITLILSYIVQTVFRFSKRDWTLVVASFIIGVILPMLVQSKFWIR